MKTKYIFLILLLGSLVTGCFSEFTPVNLPTQNPPTNDPPTVPPPVNPPPVETPVDPPVNPPPVDPPTNPPPVDPPPSGSNMVSVFMATGHVGTSMYSCTGETWRGYRTANANTRCWDSNSPYNLECDHQSTSNLGVTYGPQGFMATFGWGVAGKVEISANGTTWSTVHTGSTWAGVAAGNGVYVLNERSPLVSTDGGMNWVRGGAINFTPWNARRIDFVNLNGGIFISTAQSDSVYDLMISRNNGTSFSRPGTLPASCGNGMLAYNSSTILLSSSSMCRSNDFGQTWQTLSRPANGHLISDNTSFKMYVRGQVHVSTNNGTSWTANPLQVSGVNNSNLEFAHVAYSSALQKYVGIVQSWDRYYEHTQYYHSTNGVNWTRIDKAAGDAPNSSHPIRKITTGYLPASSCN